MRIDLESNQNEIKIAGVPEDVETLLLEKTRRRILCLCVFKATPALAADKLGKRFAAVYRHFKTLQAAGLIERLPPRRSAFNPSKQSRAAIFQVTRKGLDALRFVGENDGN